MQVQFWGVRGSIACPGPETVVYGGNTACISIRFRDETERLIIIDAGTGLRSLGDALIADSVSQMPIRADLFLSHTHWDHISGFPFFAPLYHPDTRLSVYGPVTGEDEPLERFIDDQLRYRYFPLRSNELLAKIAYHSIGEGILDLGDGLKVRSQYLNHSLLCLGYRFEYRGCTVCTAFDTEPFRNVFPSDPAHPEYDPLIAAEGDRAASEASQRLRGFFQGAELLIHDAQYTKAEYVDSKVGWGHSAMEDAVDAALHAGVSQLILFHHDPQRTDAQLSRLESALQRKLPPDTTLRACAARERMIIEL